MTHETVTTIAAFVVPATAVLGIAVQAGVGLSSCARFERDSRQVMDQLKLVAQNLARLEAHVEALDQRVDRLEDRTYDHDRHER